MRVFANEWWNFLSWERNEGTALKKIEVFALPRTEDDEEETTRARLRPYPPLELLCSGNCLVYAASLRAYPQAPAPPANVALGTVRFPFLFLLSSTPLYPRLSENKTDPCLSLSIDHPRWMLPAPRVLVP